MKIERAMSVLQGYLDGDIPSPLIDGDIAIKLGMEALKRIKELRMVDDWPQNLTLPNETVEKP